MRKGDAIAGQHRLEPDEPIWVEFARSMAPLSGTTAEATAAIVAAPGTPMKVLDVASGSGAFGIEILKRNPAAEVYAQDWKSVLELSAGNARRAGVAGRYRTIPGNALEVDFGAGYDLILLPDFLHHLDPPANVRLLKRIRAALKPGGKVATVEYVPNDDRISPPVAAALSLSMLATTEGGDAYTFREIEEMFRQAGFGESRGQLLGLSQQTLILTSF